MAVFFMLSDKITKEVTTSEKLSYKTQFKRNTQTKSKTWKRSIVVQSKSRALFGPVPSHGLFAMLFRWASNYTTPENFRRFICNVKGSADTNSS